MGCSRFARRYSGNRICFLFLRVLRCFSSPGMPSIPYGFRYGYCSITNSGFPHSEISGSTLTYSSPEHIGVSPVLLRLLVPRHPPCALSNLTIKEIQAAHLVVSFCRSLSHVRKYAPSVSSSLPRSACFSFFLKILKWRILGYCLVTSYTILSSFQRTKCIEGIHPSKLNKIQCQSLFDV